MATKKEKTKIEKEMPTVVRPYDPSDYRDNVEKPKDYEKNIDEYKKLADEAAGR